MSDASFRRALANTVDLQWQALTAETVHGAHVDELEDRYPAFRRTGIVTSSIMTQEIAHLEREVAVLEAGADATPSDPRAASGNDWLLESYLPTMRSLLRPVATDRLPGPPDESMQYTASSLDIGVRKQ
jgi:hypothetical protein